MNPAAYRWTTPIQLALLEKPLRITGIAIHAGATRNRHVFPADELKAAAETLKGQPVYVEHVSAGKAVGKVVDAWWDEEVKGVRYVAEIWDEDTAEKIRRGLIQHVSIAADYQRLDQVDGVVPHGLRFRELSLVAVPGDPRTNIQVIESLFEAMSTVSERVVPFEETPTAPEERAWDADEAVQRLRKWASSDGSGRKETIDWEKYRRAFAWYDPEHADDFGGYKLPHHDIVDGRLCVVWRGVVAAMQVLLGARGGVDIPEEDRLGVYRHLAGHYRQFGREPPAFHESSVSRSPSSGVSEAASTPAGAADEGVSGAGIMEGVGEVGEVDDVSVLPEGCDVAERVAAALREAVTSTSAAAAIPRIWAPKIERKPLGLLANLGDHVKVYPQVKGSPGDRVKVPKMASVEFTELSEGTAPSEATIAIDAVEVTLKEYGAMARITYSVLEDITGDVVRELEDNFVEAAKMAEDAYILSKLDAIPDADLAAHLWGGDATGYGDVDAADVMTPDLIAKAIGAIMQKGYMVKPGSLVLVVHSKQYEDLLRNEQFTNASKLGSPDVVKTGRITSYMGVDIVVSNKVPVTEAGSVDGTNPAVDVYHAFIMPKDAVVLAPKRELLIETEKLTGERVLQITASHRFGAEVLFPDAVVRISTA